MIHDGRSHKLPFDPDEAIAHLRARDAKLAVLIDRVGPFALRLDRSASPFESLLESILYQQLHGKAAATIHRRVREYFRGDPTPQLLLDTPDDPLRAAGVSGNKIKALRDLAARTIDGTVPSHAAIRKMSDADIVERLTEVRGIGSWTVEMLLIFRLGRPRCASRNRLRRAQGLCADLPARAQIAPARSRRPPQARRPLSPRPALGAVPLRGQLVPVAGVRSCEKHRAYGPLGSVAPPHRRTIASRCGCTGCSARLRNLHASC